MRTIFKVFVKFIRILFTFWCFGHEACGILTYWPGIEPTPLALEDRVLTSGPLGIPGGTCGKESACQCRSRRRRRFDPCVGKIPLRRKWQPLPVFLPEKFHRQRRLLSYRPVDLQASPWIIILNSSFLLPSFSLSTCLDPLLSVFLPYFLFYFCFSSLCSWKLDNCTS